MKESIEAWSDDANVESDELCEFFIASDVDWFCYCKWTAAADSDLSLKCNLIIKLVIEWACDEILFAVWFVRTSNAVNVSCLRICFLMTDRMKIFDNHIKWHDEISVLFLFFTFVIDEIKVNREFLKMTVF